MRIGIIGAPGVQKTKLGRALARELGPDYKLIDSYVPKMEKTTGIAYGVWANYLDNMAVAFKRHELELSYENTVTCGTVVDTLAYAFISADLAKDRAEIAYLLKELEVVMKAYGWLYTKMFNYDYVFYLPTDLDWAESADPQEVISDRIDATLKTIFESYWVPVFKMKRDKIGKQIEAAIAALREFEKQDALADSLRQRVRASGEDGEGFGDTAKSVPYVSEQDD